MSSRSRVLEKQSRLPMVVLLDATIIDDDDDTAVAAASVDDEVDVFVDVFVESCIVLHGQEQMKYNTLL
jgi:hypothetical protein